MTPWHTWNPQADPKAPLAWDGPGVVLIDGDPYGVTAVFGEDGITPHDNWTDAERDRTYAVAALCPSLLFVVVTERPDRLAEYMVDSRDIMGFKTDERVGYEIAMFRGIEPDARAVGCWPLPHVVHMARVSTQAEADARLPALLRCPGLRGVWAEPTERIDMLKDIGGTLWIGGQRGCGATHRGIGTPECPREPHHHHDNRCGRGLDWVVATGNEDLISAIAIQSSNHGVPFNSAGQAIYQLVCDEMPKWGTF